MCLKVLRGIFYTKKSYFFPIAEGGAKSFGVFRVKNHDFTQKNHIFSNFRGGGGGGALHKYKHTLVHVITYRSMCILDYLNRLSKHGHTQHLKCLVVLTFKIEN